MARRYGGSGSRGSGSGGRSSSGRRSTPRGQIKGGKAVQYAIRGRDGGTKYVGTTNNPGRRAAEHRATGKLDKGDKLEVQTRAVSRTKAERVEAAKLASHRKQHGRNPQDNTTNDGRFHR